MTASGGVSPLDESEQAFMRGHVLALRAALDKVQDGVVLLDCDLNVRFINEAARHLFEVPGSYQTGACPPFPPDRQCQKDRAVRHSVRPA